MSYYINRRAKKTKNSGTPNLTKSTKKTENSEKGVEFTSHLKNLSVRESWKTNSSTKHQWNLNFLLFHSF